MRLKRCCTDSSVVPSTGSSMFAAATNAVRLTAEFDVEPPNPVSAAFHQRFGFREVGTQWIGGDKKQVSLQARELGD